ncbi:MAG: hypothetical protein KC492_16295, partial [Myxococcales bacterium]|nr:hypothetical protein [Myxococcales bacterium]
AVGCTTFAGGVRGQTPVLSKKTHLKAITDLLGAAPEERASDLGAVTSQVASQLPKRGMCILLSDLFADQHVLSKGLRRLRLKGHDLVVLHILDDDELDFPFSRTTRFEGLESNDQLACNPRALKKQYLAAMQRFLEDSRRTCLTNLAEYMLIRTSSPLDAVLNELLARRQLRNGARDRKSPPTGAPA